jgi:hypothetical protein
MAGASDATFRQLEPRIPIDRRQVAETSATSRMLGVWQGTH